MKSTFKILLLILFTFGLTNINFGQDIKKVAAVKSTNSDGYKLYCISDTAVYKYDWNLEWYWWALENNGLTRNNGIVQLSDIAAYEEDDGTSRIYVISDTAVYRYDWYAQQWWALENEGLNRESGIVQLSTISAIEDNDGDIRVYAVSGNEIFQYEWYFETWYPLSNNGLSGIKERFYKKTGKVEISPNPANESATIIYELPSGFLGKITIIFFNNSGKAVKIFLLDRKKEGKNIFNANCTNIPVGMYHIEITGHNVRDTGKLIIS